MSFSCRLSFKDWLITFFQLTAVERTTDRFARYQPAFSYLARGLSVLLNKGIDQLTLVDMAAVERANIYWWRGYNFTT